MNDQATIAAPRVIEFTTFGKPETRGSKNAIPLRKRDGSLLLQPNGSPVIAMNDSNKNSKQWMGAVSQVAGEVFHGELLRGPIRLTVQFYFSRPQNHFGSGKNAKRLKDSSPDRKSDGGDVDKLVRAVADALTGVVYVDDRQVCELVAHKLWTHEASRAVIRVEELALRTRPACEAPRETGDHGDERQAKLFSEAAS